MKKLLSLILPIYKPFYKPALASFLAIVMMEILALAYPYTFGRMINLISKGAAAEEIYELLIFTFGLYLIQKTLGYYKDTREVKVLDSEVRKHVSTTSMQKILQLSISQHRNQNSNYVNETVSKGQDALTQLLFMFLYQILPRTLKAILTLFALIYFSHLFGAIVFIGVIGFIGLTYFIEVKHAPLIQEVEELRRQSTKFSGEIIRNISLVQLNAQEDKVVAEYESSMQTFRDRFQFVWESYNRHTYYRYFYVEILKFIVIMYGVYQVTNKQIQAGELITLIMWTTALLGGLDEIGFIQRMFMNHRASAEKYFKLLQAKPTVQAPENPVILEKIKGHLEFRDVSFSYSKEDFLNDKEGEEVECSAEVLKNVSFKIMPGQKVALVGVSGAGKTTISNLIMRAYDPTKGQVLLDGNDLRLLDLKQLRTKVGYVEQSVALFDKTLHYNLTFGLRPNNQVSDEQLDIVCKAARIDQFYGRLTDNFNTKIGENGIHLSGGERQRVGIARAIVKDPAILIFDEATSSLDAINEGFIREALDEISKDRTTIVIAHRLSTVINADMILVVQSGTIVGAGRHEELLKFCPHYAHLVKSQMET